MAYRFAIGNRPISREIQRVFREEVDSALDHLKATNERDIDERIHNARKSFKKLRALLRLIAPALRKHSFRLENHRLRDIGRKLAELRDAHAIIDSFKALPERSLSSTSRGSMLKKLQSEKEQLFSSVDVRNVLAAATEELTHARSALDLLAQQLGDPKAIQQGFITIYRRGRNALKLAQQDPTAENLHNLRKRVKDHWYHTRLIKAESPFFNAREEKLHQLETALGENHNLHVLGQKLSHSGVKVQAVDALRIRSEEFGKEALTLAEELYATRVRELKQEFEELKKTAIPDKTAPLKNQRIGAQPEISQTVSLKRSVVV